MVMKTIAERCACIHIVVVKCPFCSCTSTENLMVTQCICIYVHVSDYGNEKYIWVMFIYTNYSYEM